MKLFTSLDALNLQIARSTAATLWQGNGQGPRRYAAGAWPWLREYWEALPEGAKIFPSWEAALESDE